MKLIAILLSCFFCVTLSAQKYLGVLETKMLSWPSENSEDSVRKKVIRPLFEFKNNRWYSLENGTLDTLAYPKEANWNIVYKASRIGKCSSQKVSPRFKDAYWTYPRDVYHKPLAQNLPSIGKPTWDFAGWAGDVQPRPLIVVSDSLFSDSTSWQTYQPMQKEIMSLANIYLEHFTFSDSVRFGVDRHLNLNAGKSYVSSKLDTLVQVGLEGVANGEDVLVDRNWMYKSPFGELVNLSKTIDFSWRKLGMQYYFHKTSQLYFVDAGDFDNDGSSDVLFWVDRYNGNGYVLFYNNFSSHVSFEWSYH